MEVIVKQGYEHYNRTLGVHIKNREHYERVCREGNWVPFEKAQEIAENAHRRKIKDYKISKESQEIINYAHQIKDKKGNLKLGDIAIKKLIERKAIGKSVPDYMKLPSAYQNKGGFSS